jgi:hypothetical protein
MGSLGAAVRCPAVGQMRACGAHVSSRASSLTHWSFGGRMRNARTCSCPFWRKQQVEVFLDVRMCDVAYVHLDEGSFVLIERAPCSRTRPPAHIFGSSVLTLLISRAACEL